MFPGFRFNIEFMDLVVDGSTKPSTERVYAVANSNAAGACSEGGSGFTSGRHLCPYFGFGV